MNLNFSNKYLKIKFSAKLKMEMRCFFYLLITITFQTNKKVMKERERKIKMLVINPNDLKEEEWNLKYKYVSRLHKTHMF
jgi:hypothetical protein